MGRRVAEGRRREGIEGRLLMTWSGAGGARGVAVTTLRGWGWVHEGDEKGAGLLGCSWSLGLRVDAEGCGGSHLEPCRLAGGVSSCHLKRVSGRKGGGQRCSSSLA